MKKMTYSVLISLLCMVSTTWAADTDIYSISTIDVKPNVLIVFDNSGSMSTQDVPGETYDSSKDYSLPGGKDQRAVYQQQCSGNWWWYTCDYDDQYSPDIDSDNWQCDVAKTDLLSKGYWTGNIRKTGNTVRCGGSTQRTLRLGNFDNFAAQGLGDNRRRMEVAKEVIAQLIYDNYDDVRFGVMRFNHIGSNEESGYIVAGCGASKQDLIGNFDPDTTVFTDSDQSANFGAIGGMTSLTWTPLAETMAEAGLYFAGQKSWFNGLATGAGYPFGQYSYNCTNNNSGCQDYNGKSPIQYRCQKNYIIYMTDGEPTRDAHSKMHNRDYINGEKIPAAGKDGVANYLDDIAYFLAHNDLMKTGPNPSAEELLQKGKPGDFEHQTVSTYTIGFKTSQELLQNTANNGGGEYYTAENASTLNEAFDNIITSIKGNNEGFSAAAVPVSRANQAYAGNYVYYGLFQPMNNTNWTGNLKKYGITDLGVIEDKNGIEAVSGGMIADNAWSYWSTAVDGPSVTKGGAGEKLIDDLEGGFTRKIYTYTGSDPNLANSTNSFSIANVATLQTFNTNLTEDAIRDIRGENPNSDDNWPLGSFLHSQPLVVHYDDDNDGEDDHSMVFAGANDGMLHCFDDNDGSEKWAFVPPSILKNIHTLPDATSLQYSVDGSPTVYKYDHDGIASTPDKKILIFGKRRGGSSYTALDISDYNAPSFMYEVNANVLGEDNEPLGQSWGTPKPRTIALSETNTKEVFILPGGYDENQDLETPLTTDFEGRAVFAIDPLTGNLVSNLNFNADNFNFMTHSIVAVAPFENPKSQITTRVYAGDMNGNLFAFRDDIFHHNLDKSQKSDFAGLYDGMEDGNWGQKIKLFSSPGKKIFYPPNIVNEFFPVDITYPTSVSRENRVGDYVFYGTGDRENPNDTTVLNEFYAIKNNWQWESVTPAIVKAYVDKTDGKVKTKISDEVIIDLDLDELVANNIYFILDVTDDLYQNKETEEETRTLYTNYITQAINHKNNRGWYIRFLEMDGSTVGEKIVSSPIIFNGVIYFTTFVPEPIVTSTSDPCVNPGARGGGYLYAIGYKYGNAVLDFDPITSPNALHREDRRVKLSGKGIPPEPVLVIHEGKPTIIVGFETFDPPPKEPLEQFYWRKIYN